MAFQLEDRVRKTIGETDSDNSPAGALGKVTRVDYARGPFPYHVEFDGFYGDEWCSENELETLPEADDPFFSDGSAKPNFKMEDSNSAPPTLQAAVDSIRDFQPPTLTAAPLLPTSSLERKSYPIVEGVLDYFPAVIREMARLSHLGNEKHNKGLPLHWSRAKSSDHENCIGRHTLERGGFEEIVVDGVSHFVRHSVCRAWRACAAAQLELEAAGEAPIAITPRPK